eukprot:TRINITY_DN323_c0_g1_i2.p1 TRINITY_DN323_c0_g1~~TRINITY_DN323_c0_g1_i2.p1  ORF type:complete len:527 (-),score=192.62 TRINITY_DN323_c0_g1_i2:262-1842(-)
MLRSVHRAWSAARLSSLRLPTTAPAAASAPSALAALPWGSVPPSTRCSLVASPVAALADRSLCGGVAPGGQRLLTTVETARTPQPPSGAPFFSTFQSPREAPDADTLPTKLSYTRVSYNLDATVGFATSRGARMKNEDRSCYGTIRGLEYSYTVRPSHMRAVSVVRSNPVYVFGVFDGHAGNRASSYMAKHLLPTLHNLGKEVDPAADEVPSLEEHLSNAIERLDQRFCAKAERGEYVDGSTACVVAVDPIAHLAAIANIGDSRAVLCERGRAVALTKDHRPFHEDERERIEAAGGEVVTGPDGTHRLMGLMECSRAVGNLPMREYGCIAECTTTDLRIDDFQHSFILLATDGLFRVMSSQEAVDIVKSIGNPQRAAETVVHKAIFEYGTPDDTTAMVIPLMGWGSYHEHNYTQIMRDLGVTSVFGLPINEIPKNLIPILQRPDCSTADVAVAMFALLDMDADGRVCHDDLRMGMHLFGHELDEDEVELMLSAARVDDHESISYQDFAVQYEGSAMGDARHNFSML